MKILTLKIQMTPKKAETLKAKFLDDNCYDTLIQEDCDAYDINGNLLFRFRKNVIPFDLLKSGYDAFKGAIKKSHGRGLASGEYHNVIKKDGTLSKFDISPTVDSGNVGFMDARPGIGITAVCRKTAFAQDYFDKYKQGIPFVNCIDNYYQALCPEHYKKQIAIANGTNSNYRIGKTSFTTVTVNKNFQTAVHKDGGDFPQGFGNLCVYREGTYDGCYFVLPEYRVAIDLQNGDILFTDVHKFHGNTPFKNTSEDYLRVSFVMYYREMMYKCKQPINELNNIKQRETGYLTL
jgi:hypothetical protein